MRRPQVRSVAPRRDATPCKGASAKSALDGCTKLMQRVQPPLQRVAYERSGLDQMRKMCKGPGLRKKGFTVYFRTLIVAQRVPPCEINITRFVYYTLLHRDSPCTCSCRAGVYSVFCGRYIFHVEESGIGWKYYSLLYCNIYLHSNLPGG